MLESKKMLGEGAKNLLGVREKLRTGRLLQRGASSAEKAQSDIGPGAVALGPACGNRGMDRGRAASVAAAVPTSVGQREETGEQSSISVYLTFWSQNCK